MAIGPTSQIHLERVAGDAYPGSEGSPGFTLEPVEAGAAASPFEELLAAAEAESPGGRLILVDSTELREGLLR